MRHTGVLGDVSRPFDDPFACFTSLDPPVSLSRGRCVRTDFLASAAARFAGGGGTYKRAEVIFVTAGMTSVES